MSDCRLTHSIQSNRVDNAVVRGAVLVQNGISVPFRRQVIASVGGFRGGQESVESDDEEAISSVPSGSKTSFAKGESSLGFKDPFLISMSTTCLPPWAGMASRRFRRSIVTSAADWPEPTTATRRGRDKEERESNVAPMDVAYPEL